VRRMARKRVPKWLQAARTSGKAPPPGTKPDWVSRVLARSGRNDREVMVQLLDTFATWIKKI